MSLVERQTLDEEDHELDMAARDDLTEYRSHIARHKTEQGDFDARELHLLADDIAIVTCDFKMKILSAFFRENQNKFFGKRGTTCIGFMVAHNATDPEAKASGKQCVTFVMMFTDDSLQDEIEVICAKALLYTQFLPSWIDKVHFRADGAGCFSSKLHRAIQPFWKAWTGIDEIVCRISPAGAGKSELDGMFGRVSKISSSACDAGHSYSNSKELLAALEHSLPRASWHQIPSF